MTFHRIATLCALALAASLAAAQSAGVPAPADTPPTQQGCLKRHDHGAERQVPSPDTGCKHADKVAKEKAQPKKNEGIKGHDHGKFHKNQ